MCKTLFGKGRMKHQNVNKVDKKIKHVRVYFTPMRVCIKNPELVHPNFSNCERPDFWLTCVLVVDLHFIVYKKSKSTDLLLQGFAKAIFF